MARSGRMATGSDASQSLHRAIAPKMMRMKIIIIKSKNFIWVYQLYTKYTRYIKYITLNNEISDVNYIK